MSARSILAAVIVVGTFACTGCVAVPAPVASPAAEIDVVSPTPTVTSKVIVQIVANTVAAQGALVAPTPTFERLVSASETKGIVRGHVTAVDDFCAEGTAFRLLTIAVEEWLKTNPGPTIRVVEDGGIVPTTCLTEALDGKSGKRFEPKPGEYVDFQVEDHPHTNIGTEVIAFVGTQDHDEFGASHPLINGIQGLLVRADAHFVRNVLDTPTARRAGIEGRLPVDGAWERLRAAAG